MLRFLLALAFCLAGIAHGQSAPDPSSLAAAYEGILAYTAYLVDVAKNNGKSLTVDTGCAPVYDTTFCTFDQFLQDIIHTNQALLIKGLVFDAANIDETAERMIAAGAVGPWNAKALFGGAIQNSDDVASFILFSAKYLATNLAATSTELAQAATSALDRIAFLRGLLNVQGVQRIWEGKVPDGVVKLIQRALYPGGPLYNFFDLGESAAASPGADLNAVRSGIAAANAAPDASMNAVRAARSGQISVGACSA